MPEVLKELFLASLGIITLTYEKARQISNDLVKKGELTRDRQQKFITDLLEEARVNATEVSKIINEKLEYLIQKGKPLKEKQDKILEDLKEKAKDISEVSEDRIKEVIKDVILRGKEIKKGTYLTEEERIEGILKKLNIPTKRDLEKINKKLDKLIS